MLNTPPLTDPAPVSDLYLVRNVFSFAELEGENGGGGNLHCIHTVLNVCSFVNILFCLVISQLKF